MTAVITELETLDVRFPTSRQLDGSDAMNPDPDYSAAYCILRTDAGDGHEGHGFCFTIGRGNEVCVAGIEALRPLVVGRTVESLTGDLGGLARQLTGESQLRWLGPEKGVMHMAAAAVLNAAWDLHAKRQGKPLWKLLADMPPEELVALVDFRHITDALSPQQALDMLRASQAGRAEREAHLLAHGYPAYTTSAGWLGYDDGKLRRLLRQAVAEGFTHVKLKVGRDLDDDRRRLRIAREELGASRRLMVDANQCWDVEQAIAWITALREFDLHWVEEPTSPDDILGHARIAAAVSPVRVATGEHVHNRIMFKQLLAARGMSYCQVDACRLGGVNEAVAVLLLAQRFGVPVCPHAGGVGLCEMVQHLAMFDYVAVSGSMEDRVVEYVDHLHEHFVDPVRVRDARYLAPAAPGYSTQIRAESLAAHIYPQGPEWATAPVAMLG